MFLDFYRLKEQPFGVTPDPRFLYLSPSHREALASLYCAIENGRGFSAMVASPGMGKTSLLFRLLESTKGKARTAFLFHPDVDAPQFLQSLLLDVGLERTGNDFVKMRDSLNRMLLEERRAGRRFVLVVDEAQNLSPEILESIRLLSNFETPHEKLMHIVLAGQPSLAETLQRPEMSQLSQRLSTMIGLHPFSRVEVAEYINHRLSVAGRNARSPFGDEALDAIAQHSFGIPRNINALCYQALSIGCALRKSTIDSAVLRELLSDVQRSGQQPPGKPGEERFPVDNLWRMPLRQDVSGWTHRPQAKASRWKLSTAVAVTAALSAVFWTTAVPKIKMYRDLDQKETAQPLNVPAPVPVRASAPVSIPMASQQIEEQPKQTENSDPEVTTENDTQDRSSVLKSSNEYHARAKAKPASNKSKAKNSIVRQSRPTLATQRVIVTNKQESLFQVALDNYGESSTLIVDKLVIANPRLQNRYAIVGEGQQIVLPAIAVSKLSPTPKNEKIKRN